MFNFKELLEIGWFIIENHEIQVIRKAPVETGAVYQN
jgi:hypothetical protein